jgi:hypothetical protein
LAILNPPMNDSVDEINQSGMPHMPTTPEIQISG